MREIVSPPAGAAKRSSSCNVQVALKGVGITNFTVTVMARVKGPPPRQATGAEQRRLLDSSLPLSDGTSTQWESWEQPAIPKGRPQAPPKGAAGRLEPKWLLSLSLSLYLSISLSLSLSLSSSSSTGLSLYISISVSLPRHPQRSLIRRPHSRASWRDNVRASLKMCCRPKSYSQHAEGRAGPVFCHEKTNRHRPRSKG